jgi:hypothetical protein
LDRVQVAIAVTEESVAWIDEIAAACRELGFEHGATLAAVGVFTGTVRAEDLPRLRAVPGVLAVETRREIAVRLPPRPA